MKFLLVLAILCAAAYAQTPRPCVAPFTWEAKIFEVDLKEKFEMAGLYAYDSLNLRTRLVDEALINSTRSIYERLYLHRIGLEYRVDLKTKQCTIHPLNRPFRYVAIPRGASYRGSFYIGSSAACEGVLVTSWNGTTADGKGRWFGDWTERDCIPVHDGYYDERIGYVQTNYFDVTLGIHNPDIFDIPKECQKAKSFTYNQQKKHFEPTN